MPRLIRRGSDQAVVSAVFSLTDKERQRLEPILSELGCPAEDDLHIRRIITVTGRNRVFINGEMSSIKGLSSITADLIKLLVNMPAMDYSIRPLICPFSMTAGLSDESTVYRQSINHFRHSRTRLSGLQQAQSVAHDRASTPKSFGRN